MTTPLGEMFMFTVEGGDLTLMERRNLLDWVIRPALRTVPGVADVNVLGGLVRSYEVIPDNARMTSRGVTVDELIAALHANNRDDGAGRLGEGEETLLVRVQGRIRSLEDARAIVVAQRDGIVITVGDVAEVRIANGASEDSLFAAVLLAAGCTRTAESTPAPAPRPAPPALTGPLPDDFWLDGRLPPSVNQGTPVPGVKP